MLTTIFLAFAISNQTLNCVEPCYPVATGQTVEEVKEDLKLIKIHDQMMNNDVAYLIVQREFKEKPNYQARIEREHKKAHKSELLKENNKEKIVDYK